MGVDFGLFVVVVLWGFCLFLFFLTKWLTSTQNTLTWDTVPVIQNISKYCWGFFSKLYLDANLCIIISTTVCAVFKQTTYCNWIVTRIKIIKAVERTLTTERWVGLGLSWSDHPMYGTLVLRNKRALTFPSHEERMKQNRLSSKLLLSAYHKFQYRG